MSPQLKSKKPPVSSNGVPTKGKAPSGQQKKVDSAGGVKRTASSECPSCSLLSALVLFANLRLAEPLLQQMLALCVCVGERVGRWDHVHSYSLAPS